MRLGRGMGIIRRARRPRRGMALVMLDGLAVRFSEGELGVAARIPAAMMARRRLGVLMIVGSRSPVSACASPTLRGASVRSAGRRLGSGFGATGCVRRRGCGRDIIGAAELDPLGDDLGDQLLGFAARRAVADRDDPDLVLADKVLEGDLRFRPPVLGRMRVNHGLVEQVAAPIEHGHLAARPEPRVDGQDDLLGNRRLQEQPAQVLGEDLDGVLLGPLGQIAANLAFHAGQDQAVEGVDRGRAKQLGLRMALQRKLAEEHGLQVGPRDIDPDLERTFLVAAIDRQNAMRRNLGDRLGVIKIVAILEPLALGQLGLGGDDLAGLPDDLAHCRRAPSPSR